MHSVFVCRLSAKDQAVLAAAAAAAKAILTMDHRTEEVAVALHQTGMVAGGGVLVLDTGRLAVDTMIEVGMAQIEVIMALTGMLAPGADLVLATMIGGGLVRAMTIGGEVMVAGEEAGVMGDGVMMVLEAEGALHAATTVREAALVVVTTIGHMMVMVVGGGIMEGEGLGGQMQEVTVTKDIAAPISLTACI